jgi:hypothetical protein
MQVAELVPERFDQADAQAIKASLEEDGVRCVATWPAAEGLSCLLAGRPR